MTTITNHTHSMTIVLPKIEIFSSIIPQNHMFYHKIYKITCITWLCSNNLPLKHTCFYFFLYFWNFTIHIESISNCSSTLDIWFLFLGWNLFWKRDMEENWRWICLSMFLLNKIIRFSNRRRCPSINLLQKIHLIVL